MLQYQTFRKVRTIALTAALLAMNGMALAQSGGPAILPVPPKPTEVDALGDANAVCFMASAEMASRTQSAAGSLPPDQRESVIETGFRQIAFYSGKLSLRVGENERAELLKATAGRFANRTLNPDSRSILQWCFRSYLAGASSVKDRFEEAYRLAEKPLTAPSGPIDPATLDLDALCLVLIGVALPGTMDAARTNPGAAQGVSLLGRSQHYYFGRVLASPDQSTLSQKLSDAWRYAGQLGQANDNATGLAKATACTSQFSASWQTLFAAAAAGVPE